MPGYSATKTGFKGEYGRKNYKNWETGLDVNVFSPIVFDPEFYTKLYMSGQTGKTRNEIHIDWRKSLVDLKPPNCKQGVIGFSINQYYSSALPAVKANMKTCLSALEFFLSTGMFEGNAGRPRSLSVYVCVCECVFSFLA